MAGAHACCVRVLRGGGMALSTVLALIFDAPNVVRLKPDKLDRWLRPSTHRCQIRGTTGVLTNVIVSITL